MADYPDTFVYSKDHEWLSVEGDTGTVGITDHAQAELGDVVFVELPEPGTTVAQGDSFGTIESVKAVSDLYAPVSGEVVQVNDVLLDQPEVVNEDPHGAGWMVRIKMSDPSEASALMNAAEYRQHIQE